MCRWGLQSPVHLLVYLELVLERLSSLTLAPLRLHFRVLALLHEHGLLGVRSLDLGSELAQHCRKLTDAQQLLSQTKHIISFPLVSYLWLRISAAQCGAFHLGAA